MEQAVAWSELPAGEVRRLTIDSPIGPLVLVADDWGLRRVLFPVDGLPATVPEETHVADPDGLGPTEAANAVPTDANHPILAAAHHQLDQYFARQRQTFNLALHPIGTDFQRQAWKVLSTIAYGTTISYRDQAEAIGRPGATQAVGAANGANPLPIVVPCHRVVGSDGSLTGFGGGLDLKRRLLDLEQGTQRLF